MKSYAHQPVTFSILVRGLYCLALFALPVMVGAGSPLVWTGAGEDTLASTPANWEGNEAPDTGDSVLFDETSSADCDWDLEVEIQNWTQTAGYTGTVTIQTRYPDAGGFTNLVITGDVLLEGGVWTHPQNSGDTQAVDRLAVSAGGDFTLGGAATIDLDGRGFANARGPGAGNESQRASSRTASHGGNGALNPETGSGTYGSAVRPETLGSGARGPGGGALFLRVDGSATLDGMISSDGLNTEPDSSYIDRVAHGSGGSIYVRAATVTGTGELRAGVDASRSAYYGSGGGRIALIAKTSGIFENLTYQTFPHTATRAGGGRAGTIYLESPTVRRLIVDQNNIGSASDAFTELPGAAGAYVPPHFGGSLDEVTLEAVNGAFVRLARDLHMDDLGELSETSTLDLHGFALFMRADEPPDFPDLSEPSTDPVSVPAGMGGGTIVPANGRVLWDIDETGYRIPIRPEPHGSFDIDDGETVEPYDPATFYEGEITITAVPDPGYDFVRWIGTLPENEDPLTPELTVTATHGLHFRAHFAAAEDTRTWIGDAEGDLLAATASNWYPEGVPQSGEHIVLHGASFLKMTWNPEIVDYRERLADWYVQSTDMFWDLDIEPTSWTQTDNSSSEVTLATRFPEAGGFTNFVITGNVVIEGGVWTHPQNTGNTEAVDRLAVSVGGDFTLGSGATVDLHGRGFAPGRGPGAGTTGGGRSNNRGASHGGQGGHTGDIDDPSPTYGCPRYPVMLGSGATADTAPGAWGGGAFWLTATGTATVDGEIRANALDHRERGGGASGGSIFVRAATLAGNGLLTAHGGEAYCGGGGGRIALHATNAVDTGNIEALALPAERWRTGTAGTVYRKSIQGGQTNRLLTIDQQNISSQSGRYTDLPPTDDLEDLPQHPLIGGPLEDIPLELINGARAGLASSLRMADIVWISADSILYLNGRLFYLKADEPEPLGTFPANHGGGTIVETDPAEMVEGGAIIWGDQAAEVLLNVSTGVGGGSTTNDPPSPDGLYPLESYVTVTALPDPGHDFLFWEGDVPEGIDRTNTSVTVQMDGTKSLNAIFASNEPGVRTWMGGESEDILASNDANWHPASAPTNGQHVIFNANRPKAIDWDLDVVLASWTQAEGYTTDYDPVTGRHYGRVTIHTRYPGQGSFTNLVITGDLTLLDGTWQHSENDGGDVQTDRLSVSVGGDFILGDQAAIDVSRRGFASERGPAPGNAVSRSSQGYGASHGGRAGSGADAESPPCYGSVLCPETLGSGTRYRGGGALRMDVTGHSQIEGEIAAGPPEDGSSQPGSAGGSIWLTTGTLDGAGHLDATGGSGAQAGGGGRIAVHLTEGMEFGDVTFAARGGMRTQHGAAGTIVLLPAAGRGQLIIDNQGRSAATGDRYTELPASIDGDPNELRHLELTVIHGGRVGITAPDTIIADLTWFEPDARLHLFGNDLHVRSFYHPFASDQDAVVDAQGGEIFWLRPGSIIKIR